jgi:hypothetical protein
MTVPAISTGTAILAWIGLAAGVGVLALVIALLNRVLGPAREIDAYARDILAASLATAGNLEGVDELAHTRELGGAVPGLATAYLRKLQDGTS